MNLKEIVNAVRKGTIMNPACSLSEEDMTALIRLVNYASGEYAELERVIIDYLYMYQSLALRFIEDTRYSPAQISAALDNLVLRGIVKLGDKGLYSLDFSPLENLIYIHVRASGPASFASIQHWVADQYNGSAEDYKVSEALTGLIRHGLIKLYDDGTSFVIA